MQVTRTEFLAGLVATLVGGPALAGSQRRASPPVRAATRTTWMREAQIAEFTAICSPDPLKTPGAWATPATPTAALCALPSAPRAAVDPAILAEVLDRYRLSPAHAKSGRFRLVRLVPNGLDGLDIADNIFPIDDETYPLACYKKNTLDETMIRAVCDGTLALADAQLAIARNWPLAYSTFVMHEPAPQSPTPPTSVMAQTAASTN